jgi:hypothetical protein
MQGREFIRERERIRQGSGWIGIKKGVTGCEVKEL